MSLDLVIHGPRADIRQLFRQRGWIVPVLDDEGNQTGEFTNRPGLDWVPWNGSGSIMRAPKTLRSSLAVDVVQGGQFGFNIGATTPPWLDSTVTAEANGEVIGTYDRKQGNFAVFTPTGTLPTVGDTLDVYTQPVFVPGFAVIVRLSYDIERNDRADDGLDEDGEEIPEAYEGPWRRSRLMAKLRKVGTLQDTAGMPNYQLPNGLRVFRYEDVQDKCVNDWGTPGHVFL